MKVTKRMKEYKSAYDQGRFDLMMDTLIYIEKNKMTLDYDTFVKWLKEKATK